MDKVKYINHLGETLDLRSTAIMSNYLALKNFIQSMLNDKLISEGKSIPLLMVCSTRADANRLIDTLEKDSINNVYGKLYINDWYIRAIYQGFNVIGEYGNKIKLEVNFYVEETLFTKETEFKLSSTSQVVNRGLNFPFNFSFNFGADVVSASSVSNNELLNADFIIKIDKPSATINISIDANSYIVDSVIEEGEVFVLNTADKEVYKETALGKTSLLGAADDNSYIFNSISSGVHRVAWTGDFSLYFTLLEHRRTPTWI